MSDLDDNQTNPDMKESQQPFESSSSKSESKLLKKLFWTVGIVVAIAIIVILCFLGKKPPIDSTPEIQELSNEWEALKPKLEELLSLSFQTTLEQRLRDCEGNHKNPNMRQSAISSFKELMENLKKSTSLAKEFRSNLDVMEKDFLFSENLPEEWETVKLLDAEAVSALEKEDFTAAMHKWENGIRQLGGVAESVKSLKEMTAHHIDDVKNIIRELEENDIKENIPDEWKDFKAKHSSGDGRELEVETLFNQRRYRQSKEKCEDLPQELDRLRKRLGEVSLSYQKQLEKKAEDLKEARQALEHSKMLFQKAEDMNAARHDFFKLRFRKLKTDADELKEQTEKKWRKTSEAELREKAEKLKQDINQLIMEIKELAMLQKQAEEEHTAFANNMNDLKDYQDFWNEDSVRLWEECRETEQEYRQSFEDFDFVAARELCRKMHENAMRMSLFLHTKGEKETSELRQKVQNQYDKFIRIQPAPTERKDFEICKSLHDDSQRRFDDRSFPEAYRKLQEAIKKINSFMTGHFRTGCAKLQAEEDWPALKELAMQWLDYDPPNKAALKTHETADLNINRNQFMSSFRQENRAGNLEKMKAILKDWNGIFKDWRIHMQREGELPPEDNQLLEAEQLHRELTALEETQAREDWRKALNDSVELQHNGLGKESQYVADTVERCVKELLGNTKKNVRQTVSLENRITAWQQVAVVAEDILNRLKENRLAKETHAEAQKKLDVLQKVKASTDVCHQALKNEKLFDILDSKLTETISACKNKYGNDDSLKGLKDIQDIEIIQSKCKDLKKLCDGWEQVKKDYLKADAIRDQVVKLVEGIILPYDGTCAFAEECIRLTGQAIRTLALPDGQQIVLLCVRQDNGIPFWMGQCEVTQGQYAALLNAKPWDSEKKKWYDMRNRFAYETTWFGDQAADIRSYVKNMDKSPSKEFKAKEQPVNSVSWDEAFAWCESLNHYLHLQQDIGPFKEQNYAMRLPTVTEWQTACGDGALPQYSSGNGPVPAQKAPINGLGFQGLLGNVAEWTAESMNKNGRPFFVLPQVFSLAHQNEPSFERIYMGGSWRTVSSLDNPFSLSKGTGGTLKTITQSGIEGTKQKTQPIKGMISPEIGFRVVWGPNITPAQ